MQSIRVFSRTSALSLALSVSLSFASHSQAANSPFALRNGLKVHEFVLKNGLQVLIVPDSSVPIFAYQIWIGTGSAREQLDPRLKRAGFAHLFEHLMFRGTQNFETAMRYAGAVDSNAETWLDYTRYFAS